MSKIPAKIIKTEEKIPTYTWRKDKGFIVNGYLNKEENGK